MPMAFEAHFEVNILTVSQVLNAYCNQATPAAFPTPTAVSAYITDFPEVDILAPCALNALKYAVG